MMKKTTSALAVAALLGTGAASAATFQLNDDTSFGVSANIQYDYAVQELAGEKSDTTFGDNSSDFRFEGESVSDNGLTTMLYLEMDGLSPMDPDTGITTDQAFIGVAGDFGTLRVGSDLGTYGAVDGLKDIDNFAGVYGVDNDSKNTIRYDLPSMIDGLSASVAANYYDDNSGGNFSGTSLNASATYDLGVVALSAAYDNRGGVADAQSGPFYGVGAQTSIMGVDTRLTYEVDTDESTVPSDSDIDKSTAGEVKMLSLTGVYGIGNGSLYGTVQRVSGSGSLNDLFADYTVGSDSTSEYVIGYNHSITDNAYVILETGAFGRVNDGGDFVSVSFGAGF